MTDDVGTAGKVFRTGGDEFFAFLYNARPCDYEHMLQHAQEQIAEFNAANEYPLSLAIGRVQIEDHGIQQAMKDAEALMYQDKARKKACFNPGEAPVHKQITKKAECSSEALRFLFQFFCSTSRRISVSSAAL